MNIPKAFALLRTPTIRNTPFYLPLMKATLTFHIIHVNRKRTPYTSLSSAKRQSALDAIAEALEPFPHSFQDWFALLTDSRWKAIVQERYELQFVFRRDPVGSIDLQAFSVDAESVHRSSVQEMIAKSVDTVCKYAVPNRQDTLNELIGSLMDRWTIPEIRGIVYTLTSDYDTLVVPLIDRTVKYSTILDHVWAFSKASDHKEELVKRLFEELGEGHLTCANGRLARLLNVLQGYDLTLSSVEDPGILLQNRMAAVARMPLHEREAAARNAFKEFGVPAEAQRGWLEPLLL